MREGNTINCSSDNLVQRKIILKVEVEKIYHADVNKGRS